MKNVLLLAPLTLAIFVPSAFAASHQVDQIGFTFVPADLTIDVGDTVEWVHSIGVHTVTHGTDDLTPPLSDKLFNAPLTADSTTFSFTFDETGVVDYYCQPHRLFGMIGRIIVGDVTAAGDDVETSSWSQVKALYD